MFKPSVKFIMLVGIPGSGKSTYAQDFKRFYDCSIISSDAIREEIFGDATIQNNPDIIFKIMKERTLESLDKGVDVIYDATNISRKYRLQILRDIPAYVSKQCHIIWAPIEVCKARNISRDHKVPEEVIDKMLKNFQAPYFDEGWNTIYIYNNVPDFKSDEYLTKSVHAMEIPHDNPHHTLNIYDHCVQSRNKALERMIETKCADVNLLTALRYHDIGKPYTKTFKDTKGQRSETAHYYGHQGVGAWISYGFCDSAWIPWLISTHMDPYLNTKYYRNLPEYLKKSIDFIHEFDQKAH